MNRIAAIVQARMGSTRLPGKIFMDLGGEPMLARVTRRLQRARRLDVVMVATTVKKRDDQVELFCRDNGIPCFRGSEDDVLDRYREAARVLDASAVVRVTSDCPFIDPEVVDEVVQALFVPSPADYASNFLEPRTYPRGLDVEAFTRATLERAWRETADPALREHVTPYIYLTPGAFVLRRVALPSSEADRRWTVDTQEDYAFAREVYARLGNDLFSWKDVLELVRQNPTLEALNRHVRQKPLPASSR